MRPFIVGTAGHVDHGKTTLVQFLTGVNTDRLDEEQERGITIELGFAPLTLRAGSEVVAAGLVDVPGHERFLRHMVAGAGGIDLLVMVVAADEGVMPQTREHLDICGLLGVRAGFVVLSKVDLVDPEWLELAEDDVRTAFSGTFLADAPIVRFSARAPDPTEQRRRLEAALLAGRARVSERQTGALFRLPIDRVFTMRGHGTVVTGTVVAGTLAAGEDIAFEPGGVRTRARSLQSFGSKVERLEAGMRGAINLTNLEKSAVERGMVAIRPASLEPVELVDVVLTYLPHNPRPLPSRARLLCHAGTAMVQATVQLFEGDRLAPGESALARLHLDAPLVVVPGDRCVLRGFANIPGHGTTVGGAEVLHLASGVYRTHLKGPRLHAFLGALRAQPPTERLVALAEAAGTPGIAWPVALAQAGAPRAAVAAAVDALCGAGTLVRIDDEPPRFLAGRHARALGERLIELVEAALGANALLAGLPRETVRAQLDLKLDAKAFAAVLEPLVAAGRLLAERDIVALPGHTPSLVGPDAELARHIMTRLQADGLAAPRIPELAEALSVDEERIRAVLAFLQRAGTVVRVAEALFMEGGVVAELRERLLTYLQAQGEVTTQAFKELCGVTRKHLIPLAEYFDQQKVTVRRGDVRVAGRSARPA